MCSLIKRIINLLKEDNKMSRLLEEIKETNNLNEIDSYYLFIGLEPYNDHRRESKQLVLSNYDNTTYEYTDGKVAFIPQEHTYPSSFLYLMKLLFNKFDFVEKLYDNNVNNDNLAMFLYNKRYVFINPPDLNERV